MEPSAIAVLSPQQVLSIVREGIRQELAEIVSQDAEATEIERLSRKEYLTEGQVEKLFNLRISTLRKHRVNGSGPSYVKDGEKVLYRRLAVAQYLESKRQKTNDQP